MYLLWTMRANNSLSPPDCREVHLVAQHLLRKARDRHRPLQFEEDSCQARY